MNTAVFLIFFLVSSLFFGLGLLAACLAWMKGYRPWFWLVSLGPVGALLMLLRPNLNRATTPEEREHWEQRADWTGGILSGATLFFAMALPILGVLAFFSLRSVAVPRPGAVIAAPPPVSAAELEVMPAVDSKVSPEESPQSETTRTEGNAP